MALAGPGAMAHHDECPFDLTMLLAQAALPGSSGWVPELCRAP